MLDEQLIDRELDKLFSGQEPDAIDTYFGNIEDSVIDAAQAAIGLPFSLSYRIFLRRYGVATFQQFDIHGLFSEEAYYDFPHLDVVERTSALRELTLPLNVTAEKVISISSDQDNVQFYFDCDATTKGEAPIVAFSGYFGRTRVASTFLEFLQLLVQNSPSPDPFKLYAS